MEVTVGSEGRDRRAARVVGVPATLTVEMALYGGLFAVALLLRLADVGGWPLLEGELPSALAAWRALQGSMDRPEHYVPLLFDAHLVLFWLAGASDGVARLLPAVAGAGLVLLPYAVRDLLGRAGALVVAALLTLGPSWLFFSRTADAPILGAALGAATLASAWRFGRTGDPRAARAGAVALGLGLTAGPGVYTALLGGVLAALVAGGGHHGWREAARRLRRGLGAAADGANLALAGAAFFLGATACLANPGGFGMSIEAAGRWVVELTPGRSGLPWWHQPATLLAYEPLSVALAAVGGVWALSRREYAALGLGAWALGVVLLGTVLGHRGPAWTPDAMVPLVALAGIGAERAWGRLREGFSVYDGVAIYGALVLVGFGLLALAVYLRVGHEGWRGYALLTAGALVLGWGAIWLWVPEVALRVGAVVLGAVLLGLTVRGATAVAYQTGRDPRELLVVSPTSVHLRDLERWVHRVAARRAAEPLAHDVAYEGELAPWMEWYFRDYWRARRIGGLGGEDAEALLTAAEGAAAPPGYVGQAFRLQETWSWWTPELSWPDRLRWLVYRAPVGEEGSRDVIYWVRPSADG